MSLAIRPSCRISILSHRCRFPEWTTAKTVRMRIICFHMSYYRLLSMLAKGQSRHLMGVGSPSTIELYLSWVGELSVVSGSSFTGSCTELDKHFFRRVQRSRVLISRPPIVMRDSGSTSNSRQRAKNTLDLPAPVLPIRATFSPYLIVMFSPFRQQFVLPGNLSFTFLNTISPDSAGSQFQGGVRSQVGVSLQLSSFSKEIKFSSRLRDCRILKESQPVILINVNTERARLPDLCPTDSLNSMVKVTPSTIIRNTMSSRIRSKNLFILINAKQVFQLLYTKLRNLPTNCLQH